jgi:hypothetical protein
MKYRKLRIAWSVAWGVVAVLLMVMWLRSCYWFDVARIDPIYKAYSIGGQSGSGCLVLDCVNSFTPAFPQTNFRYQCTSLNQLRAGLQQSGYPLPSRVWGGFSARIEGRNYFSFCVPYWFLALTAASGVAFPWLPWHKLRWQFSLRTLLIVTTLVAVVLGLIGWMVRQIG